MIKVTKIDPITGYKNSFFVFFDNGKKLRCFTKNILDFELRVGSSLSQERYMELEAAISESNTRERAVRLLSQRKLSEKELELKLLQKGEPEEYVQGAVAWLKELQLLDDQAYAESIVTHYARKGFGLARIKDELFRRHIPRELWENALEHRPDSSEAIDKYIRSKLRGTIPDQRELKKVSDGLYRRGFSWDEIKSALRRYDESLMEEET